jgi:pilus assembly protein CpaE
MNAITRVPLDIAAPTGSQPSPATLAFVRDEASRILLSQILETGAHVAIGGVEDAINYLIHDPSPRTAIVDLTSVTEPLVALDRLAETCLPGTRVIAIGEINDVHFYRLLRSAGVADYLVKPLTADAMRGALTVEAAALPIATAPPVAVTDDRETIAVIGARGGVGATMVAVSLAWLSTDRQKQRTVLADLDLHNGATSLALDVEPGHGLSEALASPERIDALLVASATTRLANDFYLLSAEQPLDSVRPIQGDAIEKLIDGLRQGFQRVILDLPRSGGALVRQGFEEASVILIVTDFSLAGVRDTGRLIALAERVAPKAKRLVVGNRFSAGRKGDLSRGEIEKALGVKLVCVIPEDGAAVPTALNTGKPVPAAFPTSPAAVALSELSAIVSGAPPPPPRGLLARMLTPAVKKAPVGRKERA